LGDVRIAPAVRSTVLWTKLCNFEQPLFIAMLIASLDDVTSLMWSFQE